MGNWPTVSRQTGNARLGRERGGLEGWRATSRRRRRSSGQGEGISFKAEFISWIFCIGTGMFAFVVKTKVEDSLDALKLFIAHGDGL